MTREKAIECLKYNRAMCYFDPATGETDRPYSEECRELAEALEVAIAALSEKTETAEVDGGNSMKPVSPCKGCNKRSVEPNCHERGRCVKWDAFVTKSEAWKADAAKAQKRYSLERLKRSYR